MKHFLLLLLLNTGCGKQIEPAVATPTVALSAEEQAFFREHPQWSGKTVITEETSLDFAVQFQLQEGRVSGTIDIPLQNAFGLPLDDIQLQEDTLSFLLKPPKAPKLAWARYRFPEVAQSLREKTPLTGTLQQMKREFPTTLEEKALQQPSRPQTPQPPFPYLSREIRIENPNDGAQLAGTLTYPSGEGRYPVAVLITGSGPQDRDETIFGHKPFWVLADHLSRNGIAVLRLDDRGVGESSGGQANPTSLVFAEDIGLALDHLAQQPEIDANKMGVIGHSEGGLIAAILGASRTDLAFIVSMAGPGLTGLEILVQQNMDIFGLQATDPSQLEELGNLIRKSYRTDLSPEEERETVQQLVTLQLAITKQELSAEQQEQSISGFLTLKQNPWMQTFLTLDPAQYWQKTTAPVYALNGERDLQVHAEQNLSAIQRELEKGGNTAVRIERFSSLNHLFQTAETGAIAEYATIEETISPEVLTSISDWIQQRLEEDNTPEE